MSGYSYQAVSHPPQYSSHHGVSLVWNVCHCYCLWSVRGDILRWNTHGTSKETGNIHNHKQQIFTNITDLLTYQGTLRNTYGVNYQIYVYERFIRNIRTNLIIFMTSDFHQTFQKIEISTTASALDYHLITMTQLLYTFFSFENYKNMYFRDPSDRGDRE